MSASELFRAGQLSAAIDAQLVTVKAKPMDLDQRFFLVGLLAFAGELDRANIHVDFMCHQDRSYRSLGALISAMFSADEERARIHAGSHRPGLPDQNAEMAVARLDLLTALQSGEPGLAEQILQGLSDAKPISGTLNGRRFVSMANSDEVLGPVLEVYAGGRCLWLPLANVRSLELRQPKTILDTLWLEADLAEFSGVEAMVHLPVRYAGSAAHGDDLVRLGRVTEWEDVAGLAFRGAGQNTFECQMEGEQEPEQVSLLEIRSLHIDPSGPPRE